MAACYDSRHVSQRMRRTLEEYLEAGADSDDDGDFAEMAAWRARWRKIIELWDRSVKRRQSNHVSLCTGAHPVFDS